MLYTFDQIFAADPANPERVASNGVVTIFAPGDATQAPIAIKTVDGLAITNPVQVNDAGYGPAFTHETLDRVAWTGGGFSGFFTSYDGIKNEAVAARVSAQEAAATAEEAAANSSAPTSEAVRRELTNEGPAKSALTAAISAETDPLSKRLYSAADPLAHLNSIDVLCSWQTRDAGTATFPQGMNINEAEGEIYVANQDSGTLLRIDVRTLSGELKSSKSLNIAAGAFTEALPYWYNEAGDLCFFIRAGSGNNPETGHYTYSIYNYTRGTLGPMIPIQGGVKADVDGDYLITSDIWTNTISKVWVYDWASVKAGKPVLVNTINLAVSGQTVAKNQGIVLNGGYIFILQGAANTEPTITVYNLAGQLVNIYGTTRRGFADALNAAMPGTITNVSGFAYENEGGCKYQGKLATLEVVNSGPDMSTSRSVVVIHNVVGGAQMPVNLKPYVHDTGWIKLELLNGAVAYGSDTIPRIRRVGNQVYMEGAVKGVTAVNVDVAKIPADFLPEFNRQYTQIFGSSGLTSSWQVTVAAQTLRLMAVSSGTVSEGNWLPLSSSWLKN